MSETKKLTLPVVELARGNNEFRKGLSTGDKTQLVLMAIPEGGEIGSKVHEAHDQPLYFVAGAGVANIGETECEVAHGDASIVPSAR